MVRARFTHGNPEPAGKEASTALQFRYDLLEVFDGCQKSGKSFYSGSLVRLPR